MMETDGDVNGDTLDKIDVSNDNKDFDTKQRGPLKLTRSQALRQRRFYKRLMLLLTKPSYTLAIGSKNVRHENRIRLRYLLRELVTRHNWVEASGVLSTLLKGTCREGSPENNRKKYWVAMELLRYMESDPDTYSVKIKHLYETWVAKIKSFKNRPLKDRYVLLEYILSCLAQNNRHIARDALNSLKQECESERDPVSNLVIGLTYYELWYSDLPKEMRLNNLDEGCMPVESDTMENSSFEEIHDMEGEDAASIYETCSNLHYHSETSVVNKDPNADVNQMPKGEVSGALADLPVEHLTHFPSRGFYMKSVETSEENDDSLQDDYDQIHRSSAYNIRGLQSLLPIRMPSLENMADIFSSCRGVSNDYYKDAVRFLKLALHSPVSEAVLLPLIQLLLLGGQVKEALDVLQRSCKESGSVLSFRLRSRLWECFDANNYDKLSTCFEDVMKKDPTCRHSLARLVGLHQKGDYAPERLVEMLALHLEATHGDLIAWREFALCLLKLLHCEEDRMSTCVSGEQAGSEREHTIRFRRIPAMFMEGMSGKTWKLRCKWWLNRHFSKQVLTSEMAEGNLKLMCYKAACASHLYGKEIHYVCRVHTFAKERLLTSLDEHDRTLLSFLDTHLQNSAGFFPNFIRK